MYITGVTERYRDNFQGEAYCRFCQKKSVVPDGYANSHFQFEVFPNRPCPHCNETEIGGLTKLEQGIDVGVIKAADVVITRG